MVKKGRLLLMSIQPAYAKQILLGNKRYEVRRKRINAQAGDIVIMYVSGTIKAIAGAFLVVGITSSSQRTFWKKHRRDLGISQKDYASYFSGASLAYAIEITEPISIPPISLERLRRYAPGFRPPQSYMRWPERLDRVLLLPGFKRVSRLASRNNDHLARLA